MSMASDPNPDDRLAQLLERAQTGDRNAVGDLIAEFEPEVRRFVRFRLSSTGLRRIVDSTDLAQSVFARFFVYLDGGGKVFEDIDQLRRYLMAAARNTVIDRTRKELAGKRDQRRLQVGASEALAQFARNVNTPSQDVAKNEILSQIQSALNSDERYLVEQWQSGRTWEELAKELGRQPDAIRKQMSRALDRVARELKLIDLDSDLKSP